MRRPANRTLIVLALLALGCADLDGYDSGGSYPAPRRDVVTPQPGVRCDEGQRVCYEGSQPSVRWTREYYGERAAEQLTDALRGGPGGSSDRVFHPERDVACDRARQVCFDDGKASVSATERYFGDAAALRLRERLRDSRDEPGYIYEPDGKTSCDMRTQVCYGPKGPSVKETRKRFGNAAADRLEQSLAGSGGTVTRPKKGVGCDSSVQICYDANGPNVKQTRKVFGDAAAKALEKQLRRANR